MPKDEKQEGNPSNFLLQVEQGVSLFLFALVLTPSSIFVKIFDLLKYLSLMGTSLYSLAMIRCSLTTLSACVFSWFYLFHNVNLPSSSKKTKPLDDFVDEKVHTPFPGDRQEQCGIAGYRN